MFADNATHSASAFLLLPTPKTIHIPENWRLGSVACVPTLLERLALVVHVFADVTQDRISAVCLFFGGGWGGGRNEGGVGQRTRGREEAMRKNGGKLST